ncbi:MAG: TrpR-related protein YerC/YecD [Clostridia bacterium]|nr:TrpR-related protein YerC/YecD [Clostridia bacterium]
MMRSTLYKALLLCENEREMAELLSDLCTYKEIDQMAQRIAAAKLLKEGKTYAEIIEDTEISSATLSRVSRCLQRGSGGYERIVEKI